MIISVAAKLDKKGVNIEILDESFVDVFQKAVAGVAKAGMDEWIRLSQEKLKSGRADYMNGLQQAESFTSSSTGGLNVYELKLVGKMANNIEFGSPSYDMKSIRPGWLGGKKAKTNKDGKKYIVIPFRHSTSSSTNMAYTGKAARANLKQELKKTVKAYGLDRMVRTASGKVVEGTVKRVPKAAGVHSYLQGMVRIQKGISGKTSTGLQRGSSKLMTFRIMSENSPADSWIQPAKAGANLLPEVETFVNNELDQIIDTILGGR